MQLRRQIVSNDHTSIILRAEQAFHDCVFALLSLASFRLDDRRPTANNFERGERASDEGKMYSRVSNLRLRPGYRIRGARVGLVGTGTGVCGAELYYGNYMINTTRPWALSSPSLGPLFSHALLLHQRQESRGFVPASFSTLYPRYCRSSHPPSSHSAPLVLVQPPFPRASIGGLP